MGSVTFIERLARIPHYSAGADSAAAAAQEAATVAMLASNESPFPPVEGVVEAVRRAAGEVNRYPDPGARALRRALADRYDHPPAGIAVGNGSCEILLAAAEALLEPWSEIVYAWPSFSMYPHLAATTDARDVTVPLTDGYVHDLDAMAGAVTEQTRLLIVCNPNNPTGTHLPSDAVGELLERVPPHVLVILDEAYIEFQTVEDPDASLELLRRFGNLVILRTFSKVYGLAGLRVGFALGSEEFKAAVDRVRQPFSVNHLAQTAATEALRHQDDVARRVEWNVVERLWMEEELADLGVDVADSQANFCWVSLADQDEREVVTALSRAGIAVRPGMGLGGPGHLRVTYGTRAENERFIEALRAALPQPG
ncbi:MAG: histidinol-phosphate transaminase [Solirubrobacterales bacterium]